MPPIAELRDRHPGEMAYIVGRGPSLLRLERKHFGPGPIITLNKAVTTVRTLGLPNPIYSMQKDGCRAAGVQPRLCRDVCGDSGSGHMVSPEPPETLIVHTVESPNCFAGYEPRYLFDVERDFDRPWHTPSSPIAVLIAKLMGCAELRMLAHDSVTVGDDHTVEPEGIVLHPYGNEYREIGRIAIEVAGDTPMSWVLA